MVKVFRTKRPIVQVYIALECDYSFIEFYLVSEDFYNTYSFIANSLVNCHTSPFYTIRFLTDSREHIHASVSSETFTNIFKLELEKQTQTFKIPENIMYYNHWSGFTGNKELGVPIFDIEDPRTENFIEKKSRCCECIIF